MRQRCNIAWFVQRNITTTSRGKPLTDPSAQTIILVDSIDRRDIEPRTYMGPIGGVQAAGVPRFRAIS